MTIRDGAMHVGSLLALLWTGLARGQDATPPTAGAFSQNAFNPEISVLADFSFAGANVSDETAQARVLPGFLDGTDPAGKRRGMNFNGLELALGASVDPYFDFVGVVAFEPGEVAVEEAYVDSRQLPFGFQLRLGQFLSSFGRLNGRHKHFWDFLDAPLVFEGLLGREGLKNPGLRLSWTAPVDFLLQVSAEVYQGAVDESPSFPSTPVVPGLYVGTVKTSFDVGDHVFLLGGSAMFGAAGTVLYGAELTYKYLIDSYRSLAWQSEYLGRTASAKLALGSRPGLHRPEQNQGGLYSQLVWRFDESGRWRVGTRVDLLTENSVTVDGVDQRLDAWLQRYTTMLEYSPTEFTRFRLQYAFDRSRYAGGLRTDVHEVLLQLTLAVGPHGAHSF